MSDTSADRPLRIGLLQCGHLHPDLVPGHGDYPELFGALLAPHGIELTTWDVVDGPVPDSPRACDGWVVSGSADSVYDPLPWIAATEQFLRDVVAAEVPLVAICFGHQLLAQAFGGRVERSPEGWGVGVHTYELVGDAPDWMRPIDADGQVHLIASHQDQVVELPEGAEVIARTEHCRVAAYTFGPNALAIQPHPEFGAEISRGLVERRRELIGAATADAALASLDEPVDQAEVASWMATFLRLAASQATA